MPVLVNILVRALSQIVVYTIVTVLARLIIDALDSNPVRPVKERFLAKSKEARDRARARWQRQFATAA